LIREVDKNEHSGEILQFTLMDSVVQVPPGRVGALRLACTLWSTITSKTRREKGGVISVGMKRYGIFKYRFLVVTFERGCI
jgi:hypothetical protein